MGAITGLVGLLLDHQRMRRAAPWDCGLARLDPRMQDSAEGFGQPIRHLFQPFFGIRKSLPTPFDEQPKYRVVVGDRVWSGVYEPLAAIMHALADRVARLLQGNLSLYLLYSLVTLVASLALAL